MIQHPCELGRKQKDTSDLSVIQRTNHKQDTLKTLKPESFNQQQVNMATELGARQRGLQNVSVLPT